MQTGYVFFSGYGNSEYEHWQSRWYRSLPRSHWVEQRDWENPSREEWVAEASRVIGAAPGPTIIVAHSLGCLLAGELLSGASPGGVIGAFLVAPPDTLDDDFPRTISGFRNALELEMPVPSLLVASADDPYCAIEHAEQVARRWGSELVLVGNKGHINLKSNLGDWTEGQAILERCAAEWLAEAERAATLKGADHSRRCR